MTGSLFVLSLALAYLATTNGLTPLEQAVDDGLKKYYETKKAAAERLDEAFYYKINARTAIAIGTSDMGRQVLIGITQELRPFRLVLNKMLEALASRPNVQTQCSNTQYRVDVDNATPTAKLQDIPRAISVYYTNRYFQCINNTVEIQYRQLRQVSNLELNLKKKFLENGTVPIRACGNQTSGPDAEACIQKYLTSFSEAIATIRSQFGDLLILDPTFQAIPGLFECVETISTDMQRTAVAVVSAVRACARRGGASLADPGYSPNMRFSYLPIMSEYSLTSVKALGIQTDISSGKVTIDQYTEEAKLRLPLVVSVVTEEKILKALTLYSTDPVVDKCVESAHAGLSSASAGGSGSRTSQCAQNYLNVLNRLQSMYNEADNKLRTTVADEGIQIALCISRKIYNQTNDESCAYSLESKLGVMEVERDTLVSSFRRFNFTGIYSCPFQTDETTPAALNTSVFENWIQSVYKCIIS